MNADMKKILLSVGFIFVFGAYVIYQRQNAGNNNLGAINIPTSANTQPIAINKNPALKTGALKNGTYTGTSVDAFYGLVQVQAIISNGKLADINFLNYPNDRQHSIEVSNYSLPQLKTEAIQAQSSNVNIISGATATSEAFMQSLASALSKAS